MRAILLVIVAVVLNHVSCFTLVRPKTFRLENLFAKKDKKASTYKAPAGAKLDADQMKADDRRQVMHRASDSGRPDPGDRLALPLLCVSVL